MAAERDLFDTGVRADASTRREAERQFAFLNRAATPAVDRIREEAEGWYGRHPDPEGDLRARFRSDDAQNHEGAFFELFLHELLDKLGLNPAVPRSGPDFLLPTRRGDVYVEATHLKDRPPDDPPLEAVVFDALNALHGAIPADLGLDVSVSGTLQRAPRLSFITGQVRHWLNEVDPQAAEPSRAAPPTLNLSAGPEYGDWLLSLTARRLAQPRTEGETVIVSRTLPGSSGRIGEELYRAVAKKAKKYRHLRAPLVVAVNTSNFDEWESLEEKTVLFGMETFQLDLASIQNGKAPRVVGVTRSGSALWGVKGEPHYPSLSAVLFIRGVTPWNVPTVSGCLYLNPFVDDYQRIPRQLQTLGFAAESGGEIRWHEPERSVGELLGLPPRWPRELARP